MPLRCCSLLASSLRTQAEVRPKGFGVYPDSVAAKPVFSASRDVLHHARNPLPLASMLEVPDTNSNERAVCSRGDREGRGKVAGAPEPGELAPTCEQLPGGRRVGK